MTWTTYRIIATKDGETERIDRMDRKSADKCVAEKRAEGCDVSLYRETKTLIAQYATTTW